MSSDANSNIRDHLDDRALDVLFCTARTHKDWLPIDVSDQTLKDLYDLFKWGPTSANTTPARIVFVKSKAGKERLIPAIAGGNVDKTRSAPVTAIVAYDTEFYEQLPKLAPHMDMKKVFAGNPSLAAETAMRNSSLQGGYLILAARSLGLDCGPMSGFDQNKVNAEFFPDGKWKSNFLCNLGYGDSTKLLPRAPRLDFDEACRII
jgi:3-hydroxypropanoate dehydrogenase